MDKEISKLNRKLVALGVLALVVGGLLVWSVWDGVRTFVEPVSGMRVTFGMYQAQSELLHNIFFQVLPLLAVAFLLIGFAIFYYLWKRSLIEK